MSIDLSRLPAPQIVEELSFEAIRDEMLADLPARDPSYTGLLVSDPAYKQIEVAAYREMRYRQRVNEAVLAGMLAKAVRSDLDQKGADYEVERLLIAPGNPDAIPPTDAIFEPDDDFRARIQMAFEALSTAGPEGSYIFHGLSADADVKDIYAESPTPCAVLITVLSRTGNGAASSGLQNKVLSALSASHVRPLADQVTVRSATIVNYTIVATLQLEDGPDSSVVIAAATAAAQQYVNRRHTIGATAALAGIFAALHVDGVRNVTLIQPAADVVCTSAQAPYCTSIAVTVP